MTCPPTDQQTRGKLPSGGPFSGGFFNGRFRLIPGGRKPAQPLVSSHPTATVMFADLVKFTHLVHRLEPRHLLSILNQLFISFDILARRHGLERTRTLGGAYMAVAGVGDDPRGQQDRTAYLALALMNACHKLAGDSKLPLQLRIGIHCGPLVSGMVGHQHLSFDVWGEAVSVSHRLQAAAQPGRILVSDTLRRACTGRFLFSAPRRHTLPGHGALSACNLYAGNT